MGGQCKALIRCMHKMALPLMLLANSGVASFCIRTLCLTSPSQPLQGEEMLKLVSYMETTVKCSEGIS